MTVPLAPPSYLSYVFLLPLAGIRVVLVTRWSLCPWERVFSWLMYASVKCTLCDDVSHAPNFLLGFLRIRRSRLLDSKLSIRTSGTMTNAENPNSVTKDMPFLTAKRILYYKITIATQNINYLSSNFHGPLLIPSALYLIIHLIISATCYHSFTSERRMARRV